MALGPFGLSAQGGEKPIAVERPDLKFNKALHLVKVAELDWAILSSFLAYLKAPPIDGSKRLETEANSRVLECIESSGPSIYSHIAAENYAAKMSMSELDDAIAFYESPLGAKVILITRSGFQAMTYSEVTPAPPLTDDESTHLKEFSQSRAGRAMATPPEWRKVDERNRMLFKICIDSQRAIKPTS